MGVGGGRDDPPGLEHRGEGGRRGRSAARDERRQLGTGRHPGEPGQPVPLLVPGEMADDPADRVERLEAAGAVGLGHSRQGPKPFGSREAELLDERMGHAASVPQGLPARGGGREYAPGVTEEPQPTGPERAGLEDDAPAEIVALARARADARAARDWALADELRARIEAAGWAVVDDGLAFRLARAHPPTVQIGGRRRYGRSADVPSRLEDAPVGLASVVLVATEWPEDVRRALASLTEHGPDGTQLVIVANDPSPEQEAALAVVDAVDPGGPGLATEVVFTSGRLGYAAALNAAIRRAAAAVVIIMDGRVELVGDAVTPTVTALDDPTVGVAGAWGLVSADLRRFAEAREGEATAIDGDWLAFRRSDYVARGPLDEGFRTPPFLDVWWSLVLRDEGPERPPRRAVTLSVPLIRHDRREPTTEPEAERARRSKRNRYRVIRRFGRRRDLAVPAPVPPSGDLTLRSP